MENKSAPQQPDRGASVGPDPTPDPDQVPGAGAAAPSESVLEQAGAEDADLRQALAALSTMATGHLSLPAVLTRVAELAVRAIPGADGAGLTLLRKGRADTLVFTAAFVKEVDDIQYGIGEGPCVTAATNGVTVRSGSLGTDGSWPEFGPRVSHLGVHSALSLPLVGPDGVLGAMNVYAHARDAFDDRAAELGELYAVPAAISVQNAQILAQALELAGQLEKAMATRSVIDHAMGLLMGRTGCTPAEAFTKLRTISQHENRKLPVVAQQVLDEAVRRARATHTET